VLIKGDEVSREPKQWIGGLFQEDEEDVAWFFSTKEFSELRKLYKRFAEDVILNVDAHRIKMKKSEMQAKVKLYQDVRDRMVSFDADYAKKIDRMITYRRSKLGKNLD